MMLKRIYKTPPDWAPVRNVRGPDGTLPDPTRPEGACLNPPALDYVSLGHTGIDRRQNFSERLIQTAIAEGWCSLGQGQLTLHVMPEDLVYTIERLPGVYCCHCGARLEAGDRAARAHVAQQHAGAASPDPANPSGYRRVNAYECVLDARQHDRYRARPGKPLKFARRPRRKERIDG